ncbi:glycine betaine ABC transporter substrate-binding protein [Methanofollis formosanus]|uniref:Glycine betaine ABC transporter substrate-binding protein n=1 Tax=Methanofollis formosanus TaxID=299308 RepID=A0A8G0ZXP9_9EURY|nr:glycine betaine ABC transporter substrate-binding protein [Methanofollis formosanus]QYZ78007.1 glycine betaine ABC transporter substrate-binding protein [Methanofollis formosanus]
MTQSGKISCILVTLLAVACLFAAGCTGTQDGEDGPPPAGTLQPSEPKSIAIGYVLWDSEIASTNVIKQVFEKAGYDVRLIAVDAAPLYQGLSKGEFDFTVSSWLPRTHGSYMEKFGDRIDEVGRNMNGTRIGLVVPTYVTIDSIEEMNGVKDKFDGTITGIEPGAGIMAATEEAIEEYGLDSELVYSSSAGMASALRKAVQNEEWIVVTGWTPHWKFARWDLKYLEDPKGVYGGEEYVATLARTGLAEDDPEAYAILQRFFWTPEDMQAVMLDIDDGMSETEAAKKWLDDHPDQVDAWFGKA